MSRQSSRVGCGRFSSVGRISLGAVCPTVPTRTQATLAAQAEKGPDTKTLLPRPVHFLKLARSAAHAPSRDCHPGSTPAVSACRGSLGVDRPFLSACLFHRTSMQ